MLFADLLFPKRCVGCGRIGAYVCVTCAAGMHPILAHENICPMCGRLALDGITHPRCRTRYGVDGLSSAFHYAGVVRRAVTTVKYRLVTGIARELVSLIPDWRIDAIKQKVGSGSILIPIPLHPSRFRERGFNQAEVLGTCLGARMDIRLHAGVLVKKRKTIPQVMMTSRAERIRNMTDVFGMREGVLRIPASVILFDDVFTTGATMRGAAHVLKQNGVRFVWAVTIAR